MDIQVSNLTFDRAGSLRFSVVLIREVFQRYEVVLRGFRVMNGRLRAPASLKSDKSGWYRFCGFSPDLAEEIYKCLDAVIFAAADDDPIKGVELKPLDVAVRELLIPEKKPTV